MSTEVQNILQIPYDSIHGGGGYTIPANKYAWFSATSTVSASGGTYNINAGSTTGHSSNGVGNSNSHQAWLVAGDSISVSNSFPSSSYTTATIKTATSYARVLINGSAVCVAYAAISVHGTPLASYMRTGHASTGASGWTASLFDIPKNNLPTELIVS